MEFNGSHTDADIQAALNKTSGDDLDGGDWTTTGDGTGYPGDPLALAEKTEEENLAAQAGV